MEDYVFTFGDGFMSESARDLYKLAVILGGFPAKELSQRLLRAGDPTRMMNAATVGRVLDEMYNESEGS